MKLKQRSRSQCKVFRFDPTYSHRDDIVIVPHNAMCFIFETHVRSRLFKHLYTDFGYGYFHQGDRNFTGSLNALHYELSTFNKIFLMTFGLQIIL